MPIEDLEQQVNDLWGTAQWDWTIGKCPEGWFFYCGGGMRKWKHKGYTKTLTEALQAMIDLTSSSD